MKSLKLALIMITTGFFMSFVDVYDDISNAINAGNSRQLVTFIGSNIDMTIGSQEAVYSKIQAEQILRDFFNSNPPKSFTLLHKGASKEGNIYMIGSLLTKNGKNYRTSLYFKQSDKNNLLKEIRFEIE